MATNLESQMQNYNSENLDDNSKVYDTKDLLNQLTNLVPNLYKGTLTVSSQRVNLNTDWNTLKVNQIYRVEDISGVNSPDKNKLDGNTAGTLFVYGDETLGTNFKIFVSGSMIVYRQQSDSQYYYLGKDYVTNTDLDTAIKTLQDKLTQLLNVKADDDSVVHLDDLLGGSNLLLNSKFDKNLDNWTSWGDSTGGTLGFVAGTDNWDNRATTLLHITKPTASGYFGVAQTGVSVAPNSQYVLSAYRTGSGKLFLQNGNGTTDPYQHTESESVSGIATHKFTTGSSRTTNIYIGMSNGDTGELYVSLTKLEKGVTHSDWSPAPEDIIASNKTVELANGIDIDTVVKSGIYGYTSNNPSGAKHGPDGHDSWFLLEVNDLMGDSVNGVQKYYDTNDGTGFIRMWKQDNGNRLFTPWTPNVDIGIESDGADLNNSLQVGTFFSSTKVTNGPGFYNQGYGDVMITWTVTKVSNGTTQVYNQNAYNRNGECATRNFVSGAGWGSWKILSTDPSKPMDFPGGITSGGVDVATAADLKSVADKALYKLDNKYITSTYIVSSASTVLYKIDDTNKRLYLQGSIILTSNVTAVGAITLNLGSIVKKVLSFNGSYLGYAANWQNWTNMTTSTGLIFSPQYGLVQFSGDKSNAWESTGPLYITYDELV